MVGHTTDSTEAPKAPARAVRSDDGRQWRLIVDRCPRCTRAHVHGGGSGPEPVYGDRSPHCRNLAVCAAYELIPVDGAA